jgi:hypothetical protein
MKHLFPAVTYSLTAAVLYSYFISNLFILGDNENITNFTEIPQQSTL